MTAPPEAEVRHRAFLSVRRFGSLDGVRFIAIAMVLWHHGPLAELFAPLGQIFGRGFMGVDLFFVLSGFLITTLLLREESAKGRFSISGFYWRRALRILPVYYLFVTLVIAYILVSKGRFIGFQESLHYFLFLSNFVNKPEVFLGISWSLSVEEQYYLLWPAILLLAPRRFLLPGLAVVVVLNVVAVTGALAPLGVTPVSAWGLTFRLPNSTYAPILIGSGLAMLMARPGGFRALWRLGGWPGAPVVAFAAMIAALAFTPGDVRGWPNLAIHLSMAWFILTLVAREDHALAPVMRFRPIARVGQISYGVYLYHLFGLDIALRAANLTGMENRFLQMLIYLAATIVISEISFRTLERYFMSFRRNRPWRLRRG